MAAGKRSGTDHLSHLERLSETPERYHIFQALRVIEAAHPDSPRLGESRRPREDAVRLGQEAELAFPTSSIASFKPPAGSRPGRLINRFFGLFGPHGPLPLHMTEYVRDRARNHRDSTLLGFADMLTHRMMGLFYKSWRVGQPAVNFDRKDDQLRRQVASLAGYMGKSLEDRDALPDLARMFNIGHYAQAARHPEGLVSILSGYFNAPVEIEEFVGSWLVLEPDDRWQLGTSGVLGQSASIGTQVWTRGDKFRIRIGPLSRAEYDRLLPGSPSLDRLRAAVRAYVGDALDWELNLILAGDEVPRASLGATSRLGHTSWTETRRDADEDRPDVADLYLHSSAMTEQNRPAPEMETLGS